jgi:S-(hydroxymethyl)glutathione dehydrogenase/alcohol dehydrogenase
VEDAVFAAVLREAGGPVRVEQIELAAPGPAQVRVRLAATGVCHSDLSLARGTLTHDLPVALGHEGAGVVVAAGEQADLRAGDRVVFNWSPACGACWFCARGEGYLCENAQRGWHRPHARLADGTPLYPGLGVGAFATETVVDADACVALPDDVDLKDAALLGCAVLTGVGAIRNAARVRPGDSVVVIGLGGVGLSAVQGARLAGAAPIIAVDPVVEKADLARELGATDVLAPGPGLAKQVRALTQGRGADHAIECVGRAETIRAAWSVTRRGGRATVVGLGPATDTLSLNALEIGLSARTLAGCMYGSSDPAADIPALIADARAGRLKLGSMVTRSIGLDEVGEALAGLDHGRDGRAIVTFA